jgi:putative transposase
MEAVLKINRTYKFRLTPNPAQEAVLRTICAGVRMVYNAANEQRIVHGRSQGKDWHGRNSYFNSNRQDKEVGYNASKVERNGVLVHETGLLDNPELCWIAENVQKDTLTYALKDLDQAWEKYFSNIKNKVKCDVPGYRKQETDSSFRVRVWAGTTANCLFSRNYVRLATPRKSKLKYLAIPYIKHCKMRGRLCTATIKLEGARWYICVSAEIEIAEPKTRPMSVVGIDIGTKVAFALSTEEEILFTRTPKAQTKRQKTLQQALSRQKRGSNRRKLVRLELARLANKEASRKKAALHQITTDLVREFTHIGIEKLAVKEMTKSAKSLKTSGRKSAPTKVQAAYNRAFLEVPKYMFRAMLEYKAPAFGAVVKAIDPAYTSQTCASCGHISKLSRVVQNHFKCVSCGHTDNADANAAKNIHKIAFPNAILSSIGVVAGTQSRPQIAVTPRKTPSIGKNSEKCKTEEFALSQNPAASKPIVSPIVDRGGFHLQNINGQLFVDDQSLSSA